VELYLHSPKTPSWHGASLKHRDDFTFYLAISYVVETRNDIRVHQYRNLAVTQGKDTAILKPYQCTGTFVLHEVHDRPLFFRKKLRFPDS
jgi:hypothetical protein